MRDYARDESGATIAMASCQDDRFPAENVLDGKDATFWMTTGMFPQECIVALKAPAKVAKITTLSMNGAACSSKLIYMYVCPVLP
jgi:heat shock protein beta-11